MTIVPRPPDQIRVVISTIFTAGTIKCPICAEAMGQKSGYRFFCPVDHCPFDEAEFNEKVHNYGVRKKTAKKYNANTRNEID